MKNYSNDHRNISYFNLPLNSNIKNKLFLFLKNKSITLTIKFFLIFFLIFLTSPANISACPTIKNKLTHELKKQDHIIFNSESTDQDLTPINCSHDNGSNSDDPWLIRHQEKDGHWDSLQHEGAGTLKIDCAVTAMALLSFLFHGHTDKAGKYKNNIKKAIDWLVANQNTDGSWGANNYVNGICTLTIIEAYGMRCGDKKVKTAANLAVAYLLKSQQKTGGFCHDGHGVINDMSVTGWCIMALKSASIAGIKVNKIKKAFIKCNLLLDTTSGTNDNTDSSEGLAWYRPGEKGSGYPGGACQSIAMVIRQYSGWERTAPWLLAAADGQISQIPKDYQSMDLYRMYFTEMALFQMGGKHWKAWRSKVYKIIYDAERKDGEYKGSWDNNGSSTDIGGRVLNTALMNLSQAYNTCIYSTPWIK